MTNEAVIPDSKIDYRSIFRSWEKFRLGYNLILALVSMWALSIGWQRIDIWVAIEIIFCAIAANICFFAGPLTDAYVAYLLGKRVLALQIILFCLGLAFSIILTLLALGNFWMPLPPH